MELLWQRATPALSKTGGGPTYDVAVVSAEFSGFSVIRGDPTKLARLSQNDQVVSFNHRTELLMRNYRTVGGFFGENMQSRVANFVKQVELLK